MHPPAARAEASRRTADASRHSPHRNQHVPDASGCAMQSRCDRMWLAFANAGNKTPPGVDPRAFALPRGDRGDRSLSGRSVVSDRFVAQPRRAHETAAANGPQCDVLCDVGEGFHGVTKVVMVCVQQRARTLRIRKIDARSFVGRAGDASCMRSNALSATAVRVASTHGRAASVARWRPDAGCRPGTRCDPARWVRAGTAAARHRAASPAPRSCR